MKAKGQLSGHQINWNQVFYFSEVARHGSLKEAAEKLELSPSTLSEHISQLESDLKIELFHRQHRKLVLTQEGTKLFLHAKQMFETGRRLIDVVSPVSLGSYPVSVGLVPGNSLSSAYHLLNLFHAQNKSVSMKFVHAKQEELERGLAEARFDFGFSAQIPERKDIISELVQTSTLKFYVKAQLGDKSFSELIKELPILICKAEISAKSPMEQVLEELEIIPRAILSSDYPSLILEFCRSGRGIGILGEEPESGGITGLKALRSPRGAPQIKEKLYALWPKGGENSEPIRNLREIIRSSIR